MSNTLSIFNYPNIAGRPSLLNRSVFDDVFDTFFDDWKPLQTKSVQGYPVSDVYQSSDGATVMEFALAGFQKSDLKIDVKPEKRSITISAEGTSSETTSERRIAKRAFSKTFINYDDRLDLANAQAKFEDGLLVVTVPQRPEVQPLGIEIS